MNDVITYKMTAVTATAAMIGLNAALAVREPHWPTPKPTYEVSQSTPTFSFFERSLTAIPTNTSQQFALEIASIFAALSEGQTPLGAEFEAVWDANVDVLYQA